MRDVVIVSAARTPVGNFQGVLADVPATRLGSIAIEAAVERAGISPDDVDECIMGCVLPAGLGQAPARQAALGANLPKSVGCMTGPWGPNVHSSERKEAPASISRSTFMKLTGACGCNYDNAGRWRKQVNSWPIRSNEVKRWRDWLGGASCRAASYDPADGRGPVAPRPCACVCAVRR